VGKSKWEWGGARWGMRVGEGEKVRLMFKGGGGEARGRWGSEKLKTTKKEVAGGRGLGRELGVGGGAGGYGLKWVEKRGSGIGRLRESSNGGVRDKEESSGEKKTWKISSKRKEKSSGRK